MQYNFQDLILFRNKILYLLGTFVKLRKRPLRKDNGCTNSYLLIRKNSPANRYCCTYVKNSAKCNSSPWDDTAAWSALYSVGFYPEGIKFLKE